MSPRELAWPGNNVIPGMAPLAVILAFVCVWPGRGISSSRVEVDGAAVREAADAAMSLWLDDPYCSDD